MNTIKLIRKLPLITGSLTLLLCASMNIIKGRERLGSLKTIKRYEEMIRKIVYTSPARIDELREQLYVRGIPGAPAAPFREPAVYVAAEGGEEPGQQSAAGIIEIIQRIRLLLKDNAIQSSRFRINQDPLGETVEFILHCSPENFFQFLADLSLLHSIDISYLNVKPAPGAQPGIVITMRIKHEV